MLQAEGMLWHMFKEGEDGDANNSMLKAQQSGMDFKLKMADILL